MDHEQAFELLPGYLDQELSLSEALEFERHLAGCVDVSDSTEGPRLQGAARGGNYLKLLIRMTSLVWLPLASNNCLPPAVQPKSKIKPEVNLVIG